jgi:hypothetical protein
MIRLRYPIVVLAGLMPLLISAHESRRQEPARLHDAFEEADLEFRSLYAGGRAAKLARLGPLVLVEMDNLIMIRSGQRTEAKAIPTIYHRLKAVSHVPLALYVALAPYGDAPLDEERLAHLRTFKAKIDAVLASMDGAGFAPDQDSRSRKLLKRCAEFLDGVLTAKAYDLAELIRLTRQAGPIVLANAADAAKAQIDAYHTRMAAWRRDIPAEEWKELRVMVLGPQMPRKHNVAVQYFAKLMGLPGEARRLVYAEELSGVQQGLNLLSTHQLDSDLSEAFFADPNRMDIDLLGNAAAVYLDSLDLTR